MSFRAFDLALLAMVLAAAIASVAAAMSVWRLRARPRRLCPGPTRTGGWLTRAARTLWPQGCGYDLSGAVAAGTTAGACCPECGRTGLGFRQLRRTTWRPWPVPLAAALWLSVGTMLAGGERVVGELRRTLPTSVLIGTEWHLGAWTPTTLRLELRSRFDAGMLNGLEALDGIPLLVRDLADEPTSWNCRSAPDRLLRMGAFAHEELRQALRSADAQQRRLATDILLRDGAPPTSDLLRAAFEALSAEGAVDRWSPADQRWERAARLTCWHADRCSELFPDRIVEALSGNDEGLRFGAAVIASHARERVDPGLAVPPLVEALADNDVPGDAALACQRILRWGKAAEAHLLRAATAGDRQQRLLAASLLVHPRLGGPFRGHRDVRDIAAGQAILGEPLVEALRSDALSRRDFGELMGRVRAGAAAWLLRNATVAEHSLRRGTRSDDDLQRATCRAILRRNGWRLLASRLMRVVHQGTAPGSGGVVVRADG